MLLLRARTLFVVALSLVGCHGAEAASGAASAAPSTTASTAPGPAGPARDEALEACRARVAAMESTPTLPGAPAYDDRRPEFLGRARGEPMVFVREPAASPTRDLSPAARASMEHFAKGHPGGRVIAAKERHKFDPETLRAILLREGYAYAPDPLDALAIASHVTIADLFREPRVAILRGTDARWLTRQTKDKQTTYRYEDGPLAGDAADLLFGDRVATTMEGLAAPLHRDLRALAEATGFDRAKIERRTEKSLLAALRFGDRWVRAVLDADGAKLTLACVAEDQPTRDTIAKIRVDLAPHLAALAAMRATIADEVREAFRFDRPEGEKTDERDGQLRPAWSAAYKQGRRAFDFEGVSFPVYDSRGNAWPPEVCVDFVLDTFERASGTWFAPDGEAPRREKGRLDFDDHGISNRRGVLAFARFAEQKPDLFETIRFEGKERVQFRERSRYFAHLVARAEDVRPGDVVAIQGRKRDDKIHQHAILVEWSDPVTGFPAGLADQMRRPRRRTWEGIMAEAPLRSLLYRVRPREDVMLKMAPVATR